MNNLKNNYFDTNRQFYEIMFSQEASYIVPFSYREGIKEHSEDIASLPEEARSAFHLRLAFGDSGRFVVDWEKFDSLDEYTCALRDRGDSVTIFSWDRNIAVIGSFVKIPIQPINHGISVIRTGGV